MPQDSDWLTPEQRAQFEQMLQNTPRRPIGGIVDDFLVGTPQQPGLAVMQMLSVSQLDTNGDMHIDATDEPPPGATTQDMQSVDIDLLQLLTGMMAQHHRIASHFDNDGDGKFTLQEYARYADHALGHFDALEPRGTEEIQTTQQWLDVYEENLNRDLPTLPGPGERQR